MNVINESMYKTRRKQAWWNRKERTCSCITQYWLVGQLSTVYTSHWQQVTGIYSIWYHSNWQMTGVLKKPLVVADLHNMEKCKLHLFWKCSENVNRWRIQGCSPPEQTNRKIGEKCMAYNDRPNVQMARVDSESFKQTKQATSNVKCQQQHAPRQKYLCQLLTNHCSILSHKQCRRYVQTC